uniref:GH03980p n=1 Tax=Drosophila melanogaster TaxID=7227 RepID=Q9VIQ4_DROME|eukprot:NP_788078.1 helical factor [Drosophila melanogaster]
MARSGRSSRFLIGGSTCCSMLLGLICLALADSSQVKERSPTILVRNTIQAVERLFNQVLYTTIEDARQRLPGLPANETIDRQYFEELDLVAGNEDYYSTAFYIFAWINSDLMYHKTPDKLLVEVLPGEKIAIRRFFAKVKPHLTKYLRLSRQDRSELVSNVTQLATETKDSLITTFLEFPQNLKSQLPELQLMDYTKLAQALVQGVASGIWTKA